MNKFGASNFSEVILPVKRSKQESFTDPTPSISTLEDGVYEAIRYGYIFELKDGRKFRTETGVRDRRSSCNGYKSYKVTSGKITLSKNFSGMAEMGGVMQGMSYGRKPLPGENVTKITVDMAGFKIPKDIMKPKTFDKIFAFTTNSGEYKGSFGGNAVGLSKDPAVMRTDKSVTKVDSNNPKPLEVSLGWSNTPFHLGIEPWVTTPLLSDVEDGLYLGTVKGETFTVPNNEITLGIRLSLDYPETVLGLVRGKKLYLFKQSQLVNNTGSRVFSALGSIIGHVEKKSDSTWGILVDKTGQFTNSEFSSEASALRSLGVLHSTKFFGDITNDSEFREYAHNLMRTAHGAQYDEALTDKVVTDLLKDHSGSDYGELIGRLRSGLGNRKFSDVTEPEVDYSFDPLPGVHPADDPITPDSPSVERLVGTVIMSIAYAHLFHLTTTDYAAHKALEEYYEKMPDLIDAVAEAYLADCDHVRFYNMITPGKCPIEYFTTVNKLADALLACDTKYNSLIEAVRDQISSTLYKLKRLKSGVKEFCTREFSVKDVKLNDSQLSKLVDSISKAIGEYMKKFRKSPVKDIPVTDNQKVIKQYVRRKVLSGEDFTDLMSSISDIFGTLISKRGSFVHKL